MARIVGMITKPSIKANSEYQEKPVKTDYSSMTRDEVKALLEEKGIEYSKNTGTDKLIKLLEGAE